MTKTVISIKCADVEQYDRISKLLKGNAEITGKISGRVLGHDVAVHESDVIENALIMEKAKLEETFAMVQERAG